MGTCEVKIVLLSEKHKKKERFQEPPTEWTEWFLMPGLFLAGCRHYHFRHLFRTDRCSIDDQVVIARI